MWSFLGPNCGCDCNPVPPVEEFSRNQVAGAIRYFPGLPAFQEHSALVVVNYVVTLKSQIPSRIGVFAVTGDGANNGLWERTSGGGALARPSGYSSASSYGNLLLYSTDFNGPYWHQETASPASFSDLVFRGQVFTAGNYAGLFARECYAWEFRSGRFQASTENVGGGTYFGKFGFLKNDVVRVMNGAVPLGMSVATQDGVQVGGSQWQVIADAGNTRFLYRTDLSRVVPGYFVPGDFVVDVTDGNVYVCKAGFTTAAGSGAGADTAPSADSTHWKLGARSRQMPWDTSAIQYDAQGQFITSARPKRRFTTMTEQTTVTAANTVTASRVRYFGLEGVRRDLARYTQSSYSPLGNVELPAAPGGFYGPGLAANLQGGFEFPGLVQLVTAWITNYRYPIAKVVSSVATATSWTLTLKVQVPWYWTDVTFYPAFPRATTEIDVVQVLTLSDEVTEATWQSTTIERCEADFALLPSNASAVLGVDRRWSDGTRQTNAPKPPSGIVQTAPVTPWAVMATDPETGATTSFCGLVDFFFYAQHGRFTYCRSATPVGSGFACARMERGIWSPSGRQATYFTLDCGRVGPLTLDHPPTPGDYTAFDHSVPTGTVPC